MITLQIKGPHDETIVVLSQEEYDNLEKIDNNTLYYTGENTEKIVESIYFELWKKITKEVKKND